MLRSIREKSIDENFRCAIAFKHCCIGTRSSDCEALQAGIRQGILKVQRRSESQTKAV